MKRLALALGSLSVGRGCWQQRRSDGMISDFLLHDALAITSLVLLVLLSVLPFFIPDDQRGA
jgi:hypothetical protein